MKSFLLARFLLFLLLLFILLLSFGLVCSISNSDEIQLPACCMTIHVLELTCTHHVLPPPPALLVFIVEPKHAGPVSTQSDDHHHRTHRTLSTSGRGRTRSVSGLSAVEQLGVTSPPPTANGNGGIMADSFGCWWRYLHLRLHLHQLLLQPVGCTLLHPLPC